MSMYKTYKICQTLGPLFTKRCINKIKNCKNWMTPGTSFRFTFLDIQEGGKPFQCFSNAGLLYRRTSCKAVLVSSLLGNTYN